MKVVLNCNSSRTQGAQRLRLDMVSCLRSGWFEDVATFGGSELVDKSARHCSLRVLLCHLFRPRALTRNMLLLIETPAGFALFNVKNKKLLKAVRAGSLGRRRHRVMRRWSWTAFRRGITMACSRHLLATPTLMSSRACCPNRLRGNGRGRQEVGHEMKLRKDMRSKTGHAHTHTHTQAVSP